jgi:hypothetical protein
MYKAYHDALVYLCSTLSVWIFFKLTRAWWRGPFETHSFDSTMIHETGCTTFRKWTAIIANRKMGKDCQISQYASFVWSFVYLKNTNSSSQTRHPWACMWWGGDRRGKQNDNAGSLRVATLRDFLEMLWYRQPNPLLWVLPHRVLANKCFPDPLLVPYLSLSKREGGYFCYGWIRGQAILGREVSTANQALWREMLNRSLSL